MSTAPSIAALPIDPEEGIPLHRREYRGTNPARRTTGWVIVGLIHAVIAWGLISGTARDGLKLLKKPMEAAVIQEVIIPPPPPPPPKPIKQPEQQQVKTEAPPPPFVPPPDVAPAVSSAPAISSVATPPPAPPVIAPPPPPPPPPRPNFAGRAEIGVVCPTQVKPEMPRQAIRDGVEGVVKAQIAIHAGVVKEVTIISGPRVLQAAVKAAVMQYKCVAETTDVVATQEFVFKLE